MSLLTSALEQSRELDRGRAMRALLAQPVLAARGATEQSYRLVRRFEQELRDWFDVNTGWRLTVDSAVARLHKTAPGDDPTRGLYERGRAFTRRRYVLFAMALSVLERASSQVTLGRLADDVVGELGDPRFAAAGVEFTLRSRDERTDMATVVKLLLRLGALRRVEGDEQRYIEAGTDVLYDVEHAVLGTLLQSAQPPSIVIADAFESRLAGLLERPLDESDEARRRTFRRRLTRRLLDDPVVAYDMLAEDELAYLTNQRRSLTDRITQATGLIAEIRAEGIAMLDPQDSLSDVKMPEGGAPGHLALLLATRLADAGRMTRAEITSLTAELCRDHAGVWGSTILTRSAGELADEALTRLRALWLIAVEDEQIVARPILSRFRLGEARISGGAR